MFQEFTLLSRPDFSALRSSNKAKFVIAFDIRLQNRFLIDGLHGGCAVKINYKEVVVSDTSDTLQFFFHLL